MNDINRENSTGWFTKSWKTKDEDLFQEFYQNENGGKTHGQHSLEAVSDDRLDTASFVLFYHIFQNIYNFFPDLLRL